MEEAQYLHDAGLLNIPSVDNCPLRVTMMFQDGSVFSYFEARDAIKEDPCIGAWKIPFPAEVGNRFAQDVVDRFVSVEPGYVMIRDFGPVVAVAGEPRDPGRWLTCPDQPGDDHSIFCYCGGKGRVPWPPSLA